MRTRISLVVIAVAGVVAFVAGSRSSGGGGGTATDSTVAGNRSAPSRSVSRPASATTREERIRSGRGELSADDARRLTAAERTSLLHQASLLSDPSKQAKILRGLIEAMSKDELAAATEALGTIQRRGNVWSQEVWNSVWTQWGRVDPAACLEMTAIGHGPQTQEDYRRLMTGWMESDPAAAIAWANRPDLNHREAAAVALALSTQAGGDLRAFESAILGLPENGEVATACVHEYFDLALASGEDSGLSGLYDQMSPALRESAWPVMVRRLGYTDPEQAAVWFRDHADDPGSDYRTAQHLVVKMAEADPAGTAVWASRLPLVDDAPETGLHPGVTATLHWMKADPDAARAWLLTQPADTPWVRMFPHRQ